MSGIWNEDTRVKFPATIQFMRLEYDYQSLKDAEIDTDTRIFLNRFVPAIKRINAERGVSDEEIEDLISEIHNIIKNNDLGKEFYARLTDQSAEIKLIDFEHPADNDFAVVDELRFGPEDKGSFRPDITILVNGIPLGFLEVKKPNNEGGIQAEFRRMLDERLRVPEFRKFFNMLQFVTFSNNMEYETDDDSTPAEEIKAGSFYSTPNGNKTTFSFFREELPKTSGFRDISMDEVRHVLKDNRYNPSNADEEEFQTNLDRNTPCNRFITSFFDIPRLLYFLQYGFCYVNTKDDDGNPIVEKHIMRYPQFFASKALVKRVDAGGKSGIIFHTQGSGKTELSAFSTHILRDYFADKGISARFYYVVDRIDLLNQVRDEMSSRGLNVISVNSRDEFTKELNRPFSKKTGDLASKGEITVVNIQKFEDKLPEVKNEYDARIQRIFFVDEAHRSYALRGRYYGNLMLVDSNAVYIAMTGTPLLSKKERSNLKFGDYIHRYFYDKSIADGYTLRIKKEDIGTTARAEIRRNLQIERESLGKESKVKQTMRTDAAYINGLCKFIENDFKNFRMVNSDASIGGMIVCSSDPQAKKVKDWFDANSDLVTGLVISDPKIPADIKKQTQLAFKKTLKPDILIVHQMLTTGYDVPRLKKMYLLRNAKQHSLLQTISRVNRPYRSPAGRNYQYGYIVDFVDITKEYDRTIKMYLKEMEQEFNEGLDPDEQFSLTGLVVGPEDIDRKYKKYQAQLDTIIDSSVNKELFSQGLKKLTKDKLLDVRRNLNGIRDCYMEFRLSQATTLIQQIDIDKVRKLLTETQNRIDMLNLTAKPMDFLSITSNKDVVRIVYEFFRVKIGIINMGKLTKAFKALTGSKAFKGMERHISDIQREIQRNKNTSAAGMVRLDALLGKIFRDLEYLDLNDPQALTDVNKELLKVLDKLRAINEENERLAARYAGDFAFVKTYTDAVEMHPEYDSEEIAQVIDVIYESVKDIQDVNLLILQSADSFTQSVKKATISKLAKNGLYKKLNLKDWYGDLVQESYANKRVF